MCSLRTRLLTVNCGTRLSAVLSFWQEMLSPFGTTTLNLFGSYYYDIALRHLRNRICRDNSQVPYSDGVIA